MRNNLEIKDILEEVGEVLGPYREPSKIVKLVNKVDKKTGERVAFALIVVVTLMWAAGYGVSTSLFLEHFNIKRLINIRKALIKKDGYKIGLLDQVADLRDGLRPIDEIKVVIRDLEQAGGIGLESEEFVKFHNSLSASLQNERTLCCYALDTLDWLLQEIETEEFRDKEFLGIEQLKEQIQRINI